MRWDGRKAAGNVAERGTEVSAGGRGPWGCASLALLSLLAVVGLGTPARAEPAGSETVARWREFVAVTEQTYDARAGHAVASFYAAGVMAHSYLWTACLKGQTVGELSAWLRITAPPELTLQEALRLNAREHGCEARDQEDLDAELAIRAGRRR